MSRGSERNRAAAFDLFCKRGPQMTVDALTWFQVAARVLFLIALSSYAAVGAWRLLQRLGGMIGRRPRVVTLRPRREPMQRQ
jgi:hypothetical protein